MQPWFCSPLELPLIIARAQTFEAYPQQHCLYHIPHCWGQFYLSDIWGCILLCVNLSTEGSSPPTTLHHRVHGWRHFLIARVWTGAAGLLLVLNLLGLLLQVEVKDEILQGLWICHVFWCSLMALTCRDDVSAFLSSTFAFNEGFCK